MKAIKTHCYLILILLSCFQWGCSENSKSQFKLTRITSDNPKNLVGYYHDNPVFFEFEKNELLLLENEAVYTFLKYKKGRIPKLVDDSLIVLTDSNTIYINYMEKTVQKFMIDTRVINVALNRTDSCLYFSNSYEKEIKKLNLNNGKLESLQINGYFLTIHDDNLYYYRYSSEKYVTAFIDLYRVNIYHKSHPIKIATQVSEEFLIISSDNKYAITVDYADPKYRTFVYCIEEKKRCSVDEEIPGDFISAYYSKTQEQFVYFNMYTLDKISIPIQCK